MSDAYYDPHPLVSLVLPLTLVGHPGSGIASIGRVISGRTGLPFTEVARAAEAIAGCSRSQLVVERGIDALRRFERNALEKAMRRRPCGVVVLESGLLEEAGLPAWLHERSRVVYVRRPEAVLLERIQRTLAEAPGSLPEFVIGAPADADALRDYLAPRERRVEDIDVVVDAGVQSGGEVARQILGALDRLVGVERH